MFKVYLQGSGRWIKNVPVTEALVYKEEGHLVERMEEETITGKTVQSISYPNPWDDGITITFTDGTKLRVYEQMQAGQIAVTYNGNEIKPEEN
jgi:hypothetical protein